MGRSGLIPRLSPVRSLGMRLGQNEVQECASKKGSLWTNFAELTLTHAE